MICLALGLGLLGFAAMRHARHCAGGHPGWHGWHHHHHHHGRRRRHRWMFHAGLSRLDASPAQERAIVDVHISRLRKKLGDDPPTRIRTVRGVGYVLSRAADAEGP